MTTLQKWLHLIGPGRRARWGGLLVLAIAVSVLEALGAGLVFVLIGVLTGVEDTLTLPLVGDVAHRLPAGDNTDGFLLVAAIVAVFFLVRGAFLVGQAYLQYRMTENAGARLSARLLHGYFRAPYSFHLQRNSAELIRNAYDTVQVFVKEVLNPGVKVLSQGFVVLGILIVLVATSFQATMLAVAGLVPMALLLFLVVYPQVKILGKTNQEMSRTSLQSLQQSLGAVRDIKVLGREEFFERDFARRRFRMARARYLRSTAGDAPRVLIETMLVLFVLAFLGVTATVGGGFQDALPVLGLFGYAALRLQPSLNQIFESLNKLKFAGPAVDDLHGDVRTSERLARADPTDRSAGPLPFEHELRLERLNYRYEGADRHALTDVDLTVAHGEAVGIVGPTGGGKSTLVDLMMGLLTPSSGRILVDGRDLSGHVAAWQRNLGMVPQAIYLIDDTLRRNIALGTEDRAIDESRVAQVVRMAHLESFVSSLPEGLDTRVGERGVRLSGGQRQRVAIARALYRRPRFLVFDEGTSALDNATEASVMTTLRELHGSLTLVLVAHRLTTVRFCDRIILVKGGRVADVGSYDELAMRNEDFRELVSGDGEAADDTLTR